ncbi:Wolframin [Frankliniella fusca]|uniref:Wolframin n=1 Tax=Frankliniella fusca TaxID=407009 RepID=A0AAE1HP27_9NEOP|nr:Wolframin [Frankliniella fusca]
MIKLLVVLGALLAVGLSLTAAIPQQDADDTWVSAEDTASNDDLLLSLDVDLNTEDIADVFLDAIDDALPDDSDSAEIVEVPQQLRPTAGLYPAPVNSGEQDSSVRERGRRPASSSSSESSSEEAKAPRRRPQQGRRRNPNAA